MPDNNISEINIPDGKRAYPDSIDGTIDAGPRAEGTEPASTEPKTVLDSKQLTEAVQHWWGEVDSLKTTRKAINEDISAENAALEAKGYPKKLATVLRKYMELDDDLRAQFLWFIKLGAKALDRPVQADLFDGSDPQ